MEPQLLSGIFDAESFDELARALDAGVLRLGFRYFAFFGVFAAAAGEYPIHFDNCPRGWSTYHHRDGFVPSEARFDPYDAREVTPILWRQLAPAAPAFFDEARTFGLVTGCAHPVHGPEGQRSVLTFIKDRGGAHAEAEIDAALAPCHLLAGYVHRAAARLAERTAPPLFAPGRLNERERQVLTRVAAGMTASQIATELPISRRTVIFHLSNARRKLGAANSTHAISMALSLGLIRATQRDVPQPPPGRNPRGVETCYFERRPSPNAKPTSLTKSRRSADV